MRKLNGEQDSDWVGWRWRMKDLTGDRWSGSEGEVRKQIATPVSSVGQVWISPLPPSIEWRRDEETKKVLEWRNNKISATHKHLQNNARYNMIHRRDVMKWWKAKERQGRLSRNDKGNKDKNHGVWERGEETRRNDSDYRNRKNEGRMRRVKWYW